MTNDRKQIRGTILAEDPRTETFFRKLLDHLGFDTRKITFRTAPKGKGAASAWVRAQSQYPAEVNLLRRKKHQRLFLVAVRDGDREGLRSRKSDLDVALREAGLDARQKDERIATPVPTWSIETWLLALLGDDTVNETASRKQDFESYYPGKERERRALRDAAQAWRRRAGHVPSVPSLADGQTELSRIDPS